MKAIRCIIIFCIISCSSSIASADIRPALIWNPNHLASGDSILSSLLSANYQAMQTDNLPLFYDSLSNYHLFVMGGVEGQFEPIIEPPYYDSYRAAIDTFLVHGGNCYWEGAWSWLYCCGWLNEPPNYDDILCYAFAVNIWGIPTSFSYLRGASGTYFGDIDSLGYGGGQTCDLLGDNCPTCPDSNSMPLLSGNRIRGVIKIYNSSRTMCTNFAWSRLHDRYANTRRDLIIDVMNWLSGSSPEPCQYTVGDINGNGDINAVDIVYAVNYLKATGNAPPDSCLCWPVPFPFYGAMDVNGNCATNGIDITFFVRFLKSEIPELLYCPDCPPANP